MSLLSLEGIYAGYGGGDILRDLTLDFEEGTISCIVGPNGAGKSTLMRVVSGVIHPRQGQVTFEGHRIDRMSPREILLKGIVQVPQNRSVFPQMTVEENVRMGGYILNDERDVNRRLARVAEIFPIVRERARDKASSLSGGQQKQIEFARGLMLDPKIVILDEPSMGLEPKMLETCFSTVRSLAAEGRTILLVEQNAREGLAAADRGIVLESGRVLLDEPADTVLSNPRISELYLGGAVEEAGA